MQYARNRFSFASRLRNLREKRHMSKTALAKLVGVSTTCVWNWEEGNTQPRRENLVTLAAALRVAPNHLEFGDRAENDEPSDFSDLNASVAVTLPDAIAEAKARIAQLAGTRPDNISISIEY